MFNKKNIKKLWKYKELQYMAGICEFHGPFIDYVHGFEGQEFINCDKCLWPLGMYGV